MLAKNNNRITIADMAPHIHIFLPNENKVEKIFNWLKNWIILSLDCGKIKPYDLLPLKEDLACHIGVSQGTIQNVFRLLEDDGYLESKQRIGTYIKPTSLEQSVDKLTSKRELAIEKVKKYLIDKQLKKGDSIVSIRQLAKEMEISNTTLRTAISYLVSINVLEKVGKDFFVSDLNFSVREITSQTLVKKIAQKLNEYVSKNFKSGDKFPSNSELTEIFKVSSKTIHDAIKLLSKEGVLYTRRGKYGTIVVGDSESTNVEVYSYEKYEQKIRQYIINNCKIGDKLPSIRKFSGIFETSEKTIRRAMDNLLEEGYITFTRGRYGGTFVLDIPQVSTEAYRWLAINTDYISN